MVLDGDGCGLWPQQVTTGRSPCKTPTRKMGFAEAVYVRLQHALIVGKQGSMSSECLLQSHPSSTARRCLSHTMHKPLVLQTHKTFHLPMFMQHKLPTCIRAPEVSSQNNNRNDVAKAAR